MNLLRLLQDILFGRADPEAEKLLGQLDSQTPVEILGDAGKHCSLKFERKVEDGLLETVVTTNMTDPSASITVCLFDYARRTGLTHVHYVSDPRHKVKSYKHSPATVQYIINWVRNKRLPHEESMRRRVEQERLHVEKIRQKYLP